MEISFYLSKGKGIKGDLLKKEESSNIPNVGDEFVFDGEKYKVLSQISNFPPDKDSTIFEVLVDKEF